MSGLDSLLDDLAEEAESAARPAAQAAAQVFYDRMKSNVGRLGHVKGKLAKAIYQAYSESNSEDGLAVYHISWRAQKAPHAGLVEYGHWQRYQVVQTEKGWRTLVRPEMRGKPKPKRRASQAEKDAYYMPRPGGPVYVPGKAFARGALQEAEKARQAAAAVLLQRIAEVT
ncbi:HK97 gp10 family phage protein [Corticibacter populi]|nr:HK97 gp10 family phage protein [Corticibacter populi]